MRGRGRGSRTRLAGRRLLPRTLGRCLLALLLRGWALRLWRGFSRGLGPCGRWLGPLGRSLRRARRSGFCRRGRPFGRLPAWLTRLAAGTLGARTLVGTLSAGARATGRPLAALLGGAGASLILSALPAFLAGASATLSIRSLPSLAGAGWQLFIGVRPGLRQDEGLCGFRWERRDMDRQQHERKGGTRKKQTGKLHDPQFINWQSEVIDNDTLRVWFRKRQESVSETEF